MNDTAPSERQAYPVLVEAALALGDDRLDIAERLLKQALKADPFDVRAMRMLAELAARIGRMTDAENLLRRAVELAPEFSAARSNLALVLGRTGRPGEAMEHLSIAMEQEPGSLANRNLLAATLGRLGDFEGAIAAYREVLAAQPNQPRGWVTFGTILKTVDRIDEAIDAYRRALAINPALGDAWWSLANLKTYRFGDDEMSAMRGALARPALRIDDRFHLEFALAKALHDRGQFAEAFAMYRDANVHRLETAPWQGKRITSLVERSITLFTQEFFAAHVGGHPDPDPIFVVGMPRSGSTLVEQILSSHPAIEGTTELPDMPAIARTDGAYPAWVEQIEGGRQAALGKEYLARASVQRRTAKPRFIDKLPNNWMFVPLIHLILPNATIIDVRRHPMACGLANYRQHYARGQDFAYDLADFGHYYSDYVRLMAHVDRVLPGRVHRVIYERLVDDTEHEVRALLGACGLPFDPACLEFHKTDRAVRTPSSQQVRQPIYQSAKEEWRNYEQWLGPLKDALGEVADAHPVSGSSR